MGGAQPLAATMNKATFLAAEVDRDRVQRRIDHRYLDVMSEDLDEAIELALDFKAKGEAKSIGWVGNAVDLLEALLARGITPDVLTDQTSAHDVLSYVPVGVTVHEAEILRGAEPGEYEKRSLDTMKRHVEAMVQLQKQGAITFDYGNNIRQRAFDHGAP